MDIFSKIQQSSGDSPVTTTNLRNSAPEEEHFRKFDDGFVIKSLDDWRALSRTLNGLYLLEGSSSNNKVRVVEVSDEIIVLRSGSSTTNIFRDSVKKYFVHENSNEIKVETSLGNLYFFMKQRSI